MTQSINEARQAMRAMARILGQSAPTHFHIKGAVNMFSLFQVNTVVRIA